MKLAFIAFVALALLPQGRAESPATATIVAFRTIMSDKEFPTSLYPQFTAAEIHAASPKALAAIRKSCSVYQVDFDGDGLVDCVIEVSLRARNSQFFVLRRLAAGWKIACKFEGQSFSFLGFGSSIPDLETWANYGGGHLEVTTYTYRDGHYEQSESHEERVGEIHKKRPKQ